MKAYLFLLAILIPLSAIAQEKEYVIRADRVEHIIVRPSVVWLWVSVGSEPHTREILIIDADADIEIQPPTPEFRASYLRRKRWQDRPAIAEPPEVWIKTTLEEKQ